MEESAEYQLTLRFDRISDNRFFYQNGEWIMDKFYGNLLERSQSYSFPIQSGRALMSSMGNELTVKLSNNPKLNDVVPLDVLFKYQAVLVVSKVFTDRNGNLKLEKGTEQEFKFDCLKFISVSRYHDEHIRIAKSMLTKTGLANARRAEKPLRNSTLKSKYALIPNPKIARKPKSSSICRRKIKDEQKCPISATKIPAIPKPLGSTPNAHFSLPLTISIPTSEPVQFWNWFQPNFGSVGLLKAVQPSSQNSEKPAQLNGTSDPVQHSAQFQPFPGFGHFGLWTPMNPAYNFLGSENHTNSTVLYPNPYPFNSNAAMIYPSLSVHGALYPSEYYENYQFQ